MYTERERERERDRQAGPLGGGSGTRTVSGGFDPGTGPPGCLCLLLVTGPPLRSGQYSDGGPILVAVPASLLLGNVYIFT